MIIAKIVRCILGGRSFVEIIGNQSPKQADAAESSLGHGYNQRIRCQSGLVGKGWDSSSCAGFEVIQGCRTIVLHMAEVA